MSTTTPSPFVGLERRIQPDYAGLVDEVILRKRKPGRVYNFELFLDQEVIAAVDEMFGVTAGLDRADPEFGVRREIEVLRWLGHDSVGTRVWGGDLPFYRRASEDTADPRLRRTARHWQDEHGGPISSWKDFESFPWPDLAAMAVDHATVQRKYLPDGMCLCGRGVNYCESLSWIFGYETLCYALFDDRELVKAVYDRIDALMTRRVELFLSVPEVKYMFASDDMGFKNGPMWKPDDMIEFSLKGHKKLAGMCHDAGIPYVLHCCGKRDSLMDYLLDEVKIDALHSFEDAIEPVEDHKARYGGRVGLMGGIDVDFLCRQGEDEIRRRVRGVLERCHPGGGYALGTGNSVANYIPVEHYLAMVDEGRLYSARLKSQVSQ